jgi:hypothetical protein
MEEGDRLKTQVVCWSSGFIRFLDTLRMDRLKAGLQLGKGAKGSLFIFNINGGGNQMLFEACARFGWGLSAYCLMTNAWLSHKLNTGAPDADRKIAANMIPLKDACGVQPTIGASPTGLVGDGLSWSGSGC